MTEDIKPLIAALSGELGENAYKASDTLGRIGSDEVISAMKDLLNDSNSESRYMAARTLGLTRNNEQGLQPILDAIKNPENKSIVGDLLMELEEFDLSNIYLELFKLYLTGSFKVSAIAKEFLDHKEFQITARVIRKVEKHWNHYSNNIKHDEVYELQKIEVNTMIADLKAFVGNDVMD